MFVAHKKRRIERSQKTLRGICFLFFFLCVFLFAISPLVHVITVNEKSCSTPLKLDHRLSRSGLTQRPDSFICVMLSNQVQYNDTDTVSHTQLRRIYERRRNNDDK